MKDALSTAVTNRWPQSSFSVTKIDYRFVVFDASGSSATAACVVTMVDSATVGSDVTGEGQQFEFQNDEAARMVRLGSGPWTVASVKDDFHPGYEP